MYRLIISGEQQEKNNIWSFHLIQQALPPYLSPVGHQWGDLTFDWQVCSVLQAALEKEQIQGGSEEKKKKETQE